MGTDKRALLVDGVPMLRRTILAVTSVADEVIVATRSDDPPDAGLFDGLLVRSACDRFVDAGPLAGVEAALDVASHELVLVVAADMPWVETSVLGVLVETAVSLPDVAAVALATERGPEPLLAVYRATPARVAARNLLESGVRRMHALLEVLDTVAVSEEEWRALDPGARSARNVNSPADLQVAPPSHRSTPPPPHAAPKEGSRAPRGG